MTKKYKITEPEPMMVNEPPAVGYGTNISHNHTEIDADVDFDLERAITGEELLKRLEPRIKKLFE